MSAPSLVTPAPAVEPVLAPPSWIGRLMAVVGERNVIRERVDLLTYECDALTSFRAAPSVVVLPASTEEVAAAVRIAVEAGMPIVPRGAGTGLSRGALPVAGCMLLRLSPMKRILEGGPKNGWDPGPPRGSHLDGGHEDTA